MYKVETRSLDGITTQTELTVIYQYAVAISRTQASRPSSSEAVVYRLAEDGDWDPIFVHDGISGHCILTPWEKRDVAEEQAQ